MPRPRVPDAIKQARGTYRADRANPHQPKPPRGTPSPPAHLSAEEKRVFRRTAKLLAGMRVVTLADADVLALYSTALCRWIGAEKEVREQGAVVKSPNGYPIQNPYLAIANKAMEQTERLAAKLGLNPSDRQRLSALPPADDDYDPLIDGPDKSRFFHPPVLKIASDGPDPKEKTA